MAHAANAPVIPPLLSSTPPPINFEDDSESFDTAPVLPLDDDEFGDFTSSVAPISEGMHSITTPPPSDNIIIGELPPLDAITNRESYEFNSSQNSRAVHEASSLPSDCEKKFTEFIETPKENESSAEESQFNKNDVVLPSEIKHNIRPSLLIDNNAITIPKHELDYNGCNVDVCTTEFSEKKTSEYDPHIPIKECTSEVVSFQEIKVEDIEDDSDDEELRSGKKNQNFIHSNSDNFFTIQVNEEVENIAEENNAAVLSKKDDTLKDDNYDDINDDDDYFQDFTSVQCIEMPQPQMTMESNDNNSNAENINNSSTDVPNQSDEDDFGEFSEVTVAPLPTLKFTHQPSGSGNNLSPRLISILEIMFPLSKNVIHEDYKKFTNGPTNVLNLDSIDAAKALKYQWQNSKVRNTLIRSLGIDARNILYGEKWNSSMPRFAANLSFDPLKPQKSHANETAHISEGLSSVIPTQSAQETQCSDPKSDTQPVDLVMGGTSASSPISLGAPLDGAQETFCASKNEMDDASYDSAPQQDNPFQVNDDCNTECETTASTFVAPTAAGTIPTVLPTDSISSCFDIHINQVEIVGQPEVGLSIDSLTVFPSPNEVGANNEKDTDTPTSSASTNVIGVPVSFEHVVVNDDDISEVVTKSTFAGPLKETHIYTPPRSDSVIAKSAKVAEVDFDYEKAALGIIIDESVVKKEYRDIVYNPGFDLEVAKINDSELTRSQPDQSANSDQQSFEVDDDFSDFQSVAPSVGPSNMVNIPVTVSNFASPNHIKTNISDPTKSRTNTPTTTEGMILSPAILLPQAISIQSKEPKVEWGDSAANINPDELARIDELFSQPKMSRSNEHSSPHKTPLTHDMSKSLTISENVAQREQTTSNDDDWSDFVSVPLSNAIHANKSSLSIVNNNHGKGFLAQHPTTFSPQHKHRTSARNYANNSIADGTSNANDDEWSDFVSSTPIASHSTNHLHITETGPQFNSAAWQNANFYNNPLSCYQQNFVNVPKPSPLKARNHNNNNNNNNFVGRTPNQQLNQVSHNQMPQQVRIMHDFSTMTPHHNVNMYRQPPAYTNSQFQVGNARIAPSISLIPDLGFAAPSTTGRPTFVNSIPKPAFSAKK